MGLVTFFAIECAVLTRKGLQLDTHLGMTGKAGWLDRIEGIEIDFQRAVWRMALGASAQCEMRISRWRVAGGTRYFGCDSGLWMAGMAIGTANPRMPPVTVGTAYLRTVRTAAFVDIGNLRLVAGRTQSGGRSAREVGLGRLVWRMAAQAISIGHG